MLSLQGSFIIDDMSMQERLNFKSRASFPSERGSLNLQYYLRHSEFANKFFLWLIKVKVSVLKNDLNTSLNLSLFVKLKFSDLSIKLFS